MTAGDRRHTPVTILFRQPGGVFENLTSETEKNDEKEKELA
jgi:hypothetical protein